MLNNVAKVNCVKVVSGIVGRIKLFDRDPETIVVGNLSSIFVEFYTTD